MTDTSNVIIFRPRQNSEALRRPRALIRAARAGQSGFRRERDLPRLLRSDHCPRPGASLSRLRAQEAMLNEARLEKSTDYDMQRHVLLMIAILAEMRAAVEATPVSVSDLAAAASVNARGTASRAHL